LVGDLVGGGGHAGTVANAGVQWRRSELGRDVLALDLLWVS
jgi:hypothetical protein